MTDELSLARDGETWIVRRGEAELRVADRKGLHYLAVLVAHPGVELHATELATTDERGRAATGVTDLVAIAPEGSVVEARTGIAALDPTAKRQYRERLDALREELDEAERFNDPERAERARQEIDFIGTELSAAVGLGGRDRPLADDAERARVNVTKRIKAAIGKIEELDPGLGRYLGRTIRTGIFCVYEPEQSTATPRREDRGAEALVGSQPPPRVDHDRAPFVGRSAELARCSDAISRALGGQGGVLLISGEPGVGKSRLCEAAAELALRGGMVSATGGCHESHRGLPYRPWVEIIEAAAADLPAARLRELLGAGGGEIARLVPRLRIILPDLPEPLPLPSEQQRRHTFNMVSDFLLGLARERPRLFVLEDLHWAEEATLLLLEHLAESTADEPILFLATHRDLPSEIPESLASMLARFARTRQAETIALARHTETEVGALIAGLSGHEAPGALTQTIYSQTDGNAFFVEEVYRELAASGELLDQDGALRADAALARREAPTSVRLVVEQRLAGLSPEARETLTAACVIGRSFSFELLREVCATDRDRLLDALDEAERARLLSAVAAGDDERIGFSHELVRQTLVAGLSAPRRRSQHLLVADALEQMRARGADTDAADIAHHLVEAGSMAEADRTARFLVLAGDRAFEGAAFEQATRMYRRALATNVLPELQRAEVLHRIGLGLRSTAPPEESIRVLEEAFELFVAAGEPVAAAEVARAWADQLALIFRFEQVGRTTRLGLAALGGLDRPQRAILLGLLATAEGIAGRYDDAHAHLLEAQEVGARMEDKWVTARLEIAATDHHYYFMQFDDCTAAAERAALRMRELGDSFALADALTMRAIADIYLGRFEPALEAFGELDELARRQGSLGPWTSAALRSRFVIDAARVGDLDSLQPYADELVRLAEGSDGGWAPIAQSFMGTLELWRGDWGAAQRTLTDGVRLSRPGLWFGVPQGCLMVALALAGEQRRVNVLLTALDPQLPRAGSPGTLGAWSMALFAAESAALIGDADRAGTLYPLVKEAIATGTVLRLVDGRLLQTCAGVTASAAGLHDEARDHFELALEQAETLPHRIEQPQVREAYARALLAVGETERATALVTDAIASYGEIGMARHKARAEQLAEQLPG